MTIFDVLSDAIRQIRDIQDHPEFNYWYKDLTGEIELVVTMMNTLRARLAGCPLKRLREANDTAKGIHHVCCNCKEIEK